MLCLGIDSGTRSTKALVLDIESGEFIALAQRNGTIEACLQSMSNRSRKPGQKPPARPSPNASTRSESDAVRSNDRGQRLADGPVTLDLAEKLKTAGYL